MSEEQAFRCRVKKTWKDIKQKLPGIRRVIWRFMVIVVLFAVASRMIILLIFSGYGQSWTGFGKPIESLLDDSYQSKTLWDWLDLFIVPLVLAFVAIWYNYRRDKTEREVAAERLRGEALQTYFERMSNISYGKKKGFIWRKKDEVDRKKALARAYTLSTLQELDGKRKGLLLRFLHGAGLINKDDPKVKMDRTNLRGANLEKEYLYGAGLRGTDLQGANLYEANLNHADMDSIGWREVMDKGISPEEADLVITGLENANLRKAHLKETDLRWAVLNRANLQCANLQGARINRAIFQDADLRGADLTDAKAGLLEGRDKKRYETIFLRAKLCEAILNGANLEGANLTDADLRGANLTGAILVDAKLDRANLHGAKGTIAEQLDKATGDYIDPAANRLYAWIRWLLQGVRRLWDRKKAASNLAHIWAHHYFQWENLP